MDGMKIGVITAMEKERVQVRALLGSCRDVEQGGRAFCVGRLGEAEVVLVESGIGKVNAALGVAELVRGFAPDAIVSTGVAGGVDASRADVLDVVAASEFVYHDVDCGDDNLPGQIQGMPPRFKPDARLLAAAREIAADAKVVTGLVATGDKFVSRPADVEAIRRMFPEVVAVDMESCALAQACHVYGVPFASFRIVSDVPGCENHYAKYADFWKTMADKSFGVIRAYLGQLAHFA